MKPSYNSNPIYANTVLNATAPIQAVAFAENNATYSEYFPNINETGARSYLSEYKWPVGLQELLLRNLTKIPIRFMICDDSGSMVANDGHKLVGKDQNAKLVSCSRWSELGDAMKFHMGLARAACATTEIRLLNGSAPIRIGSNPSTDGVAVSALTALFNESPGGGTPLCRHISEVIFQIQAMEQQLRANNQKACVVIATDGESSDGDIATAMRPLERLPVWVVVRLCTDDDKIVEYWNNIDSQLELDMDVLDDLSGEAAEVTEKNAWLTYGEPLHRLREFGVPVKEIDLLDEAKLSADQLRIMCYSIFGGNLNDIPSPHEDWKVFINYVKTKNASTLPTWSPIHKAVKPWINVQQLGYHLGKSSMCFCSIS